jgi:NTP pyrophosphatase (non-canonical NTP hydrolase)
MNTQQLQQQSSELLDKIDSRRPDKMHNAETTFIHLVEELGEIARQLTNEKIGRDKLNKEKLSEEIADCMIFLSKLSDNYNLDLEKAIENKIKKLKERFNV